MPKQATCSALVRRFPMLFQTRYTSEKSMGTVLVAISPTTTGMSGHFL